MQYSLTLLGLYSRCRCWQWFTVIFDERLHLLLNTLVPFGDVHMKRIVTARFAVRPFPPLIEGRHQTRPGFRNHMINCSHTQTHTGVRQILKSSYGLIGTSNQLKMLLWNEDNGDVKTVSSYFKHTVSILSALLSGTFDDGCIINNTGDSAKQYSFHNT